jgi:hypothetical protein
VWTTEADHALAQLKDFLSKPPVLTAHRKKEQLCSTATTHVVSTAIVVERQEDDHAYPTSLLRQRGLFRVQGTLPAGTEAILRSAYHYFQEYSIAIIIDYPLDDIMCNQDATGRLSK